MATCVKDVRKGAKDPLVLLKEKLEKNANIGGRLLGNALTRSAGSRALVGAGVGAGTGAGIGALTAEPGEGLRGAVKGGIAGAAVGTGAGLAAKPAAHSLLTHSRGAQVALRQAGGLSKNPEWTQLSRGYGRNMRAANAPAAAAGPAAAAKPAEIFHFPPKAAPAPKAAPTDDRARRAKEVERIQAKRQAERAGTKTGALRGGTPQQASIPQQAPSAAQFSMGGLTSSPAANTAQTSPIPKMAGEQDALIAFGLQKEALAWPAIGKAALRFGGTAVRGIAAGARYGTQLAGRAVSGIGRGVSRAFGGPVNAVATGATLIPNQRQPGVM